MIHDRTKAAFFNIVTSLDDNGVFPDALEDILLISTAIELPQAELEDKFPHLFEDELEEDSDDDLNEEDEA